MNFKIIISIYFLILIIGCEKEKEDDINPNDITVITSDYEEEPFFYNLMTGLENSLDWHLSLQEIMVTSGYVTASMPTIITNSSTLIGIENNIEYDDLIILPENTEWLPDTTLLSYAGDHIVLDYTFTCENPNHNHIPNTHEILVPNYVYLFKIINTEEIYKVKFEEYASGFVFFKYSKLE